jgi:hypothetical protein
MTTCPGLFPAVSGGAVARPFAPVGTTALVAPAGKRAEPDTTVNVTSDPGTAMPPGVVLTLATSRRGKASPGRAD